MIVLDTNVVSEVMKPHPRAAVVDWLNTENSAHLYFTSVSVGEIEYGLRSLPDGRRRTHLMGLFESFITRAFAGRILAFELASARIYGELMSERRASGHPMSIADGQIAATARVHGFTIATRNVRDFVGCGLELVDPFAA